MRKTLKLSKKTHSDFSEEMEEEKPAGHVRVFAKI